MSKNDKGGVGTVLAIVGAVVAVVAIPIVIWVLTVGASDMVGQGEAIRKVNDSGNRLAQQAYFEQTYADIQAADRKLAVLVSDARAYPTDPAARTRLTGAKNYCQSLVGDYNAAARKEVAAKFKAVDLPAQIDLTDPSTDCE